MIRLTIAFVFALVASAASAETLTERGDYLVNTILTCGNCHTPKGPTGDIADKAFSGGLTFDEPPFKVTAPNITQDPETGIGKWSDAEIKTLLRTGERPNGTPIAAVMPTGFYRIVTERDMNAIVAYLRTIKPIKNKVPDPIYHFAALPQTPPGGEKPYTEAMLKDKLKNGFYLATIGHCMECHTSMGPKGHDFAADLGKGGMEFPGPWGKSVSRNITSSKTKGIGDWSDSDIKRAITTGMSKDGSHLKPPMGYGYYAKMTDSDLSDVIAYLRTVPAKE
jgi:mono/diheme cytochrome c family protein